MQGNRTTGHPESGRQPIENGRHDGSQVEAALEHLADLEEQLQLINDATGFVDSERMCVSATRMVEGTLILTMTQVFVHAGRVATPMPPNDFGSHPATPKM